MLFAIDDVTMCRRLGRFDDRGSSTHRAIGQYDLPRRSTTAAEFISSNVDAFAEEWSMPVDELR